MAKTFDIKCLELADAFLRDEPELNTRAARDTLASAIQQCIEDEISFMRSVMEKPSEIPSFEGLRHGLDRLTIRREVA